MPRETTTVTETCELKTNTITETQTLGPITSTISCETVTKTKSLPPVTIAPTCPPRKRRRCRKCEKGEYVDREQDNYDWLLVEIIQIIRTEFDNALNLGPGIIIDKDFGERLNAVEHVNNFTQAGVRNNGFPYHPLKHLINSLLNIATKLQTPNTVLDFVPESIASWIILFERLGDAINFIHEFQILNGVCPEDRKHNSHFRASKSVNLIAKDVLKSQQAHLETKLKTIIKLKCMSPRPLREYFARCFVAVYTYGETKGLYEFCNFLLDLLTGAFKSQQEYSRLVVLSVLGSVMEKVGGRVSTIGVEAVAILLKYINKFDKECIKNNVRIESIETLMKTLNGVGKAINEGIHKDVFKVMKGLMSDKNAQVRISAANCLNSLFMTSTIAIQFSEVENLVLFVLKCFDESELFRKALARMIGNILASTQKPQCGVKIVDKKKKIVNKEGEQGGICSVIEMLNLLYTPISKMNGLSHETCMGLIEIYSVLFSILGAEIFEEEMTMAISHVLSFLDLPKIPSDKKEMIYEKDKINNFNLNQKDWERGTECYC
ncbi:hypothetical protein ROZALSC1DRAFT_23579 [Rozella allomycis CSF55]|uniref:ARM repeat-containing protein n=1 Tax=Rozella allomycis (strain CSF55) TaxID=988480 RepID=A0A4P9YHB2_ROZAC|nr:hypothetical protein ROZALSC1DRAFT_23579 [Rozella allomycis CSF55]